ncbi:UbiA prenyltransferase [Aspergillus karnatakaensis]|uniref:4-hydroxybenzoate octaprenyltransferase n=1 Tax=Aspergillus karnatakaensis TaxID=1810916 RepID=UPI003CCCDAE3
MADQYTGNHRSGWLKSVPDSALPYIQLARLKPPVGFCLIFFPHLFGLLLSAALYELPFDHVLHASLLLLGGSFFVSNAIHTWNDLIDAPLDAQVQRTAKRPIPRGAVSPTAALLFTATQAIGALLFLPFLPGGFVHSTLWAIPGIVGWAYYPWAKRHTYYPQLVLGFCLSWGVVMGCLALGIPLLTGDWDDDEGSLQVTVQFTVLCLFGANILWTMIYDTIYAHQDVADDRKIGIKSIAVLYGEQTKSLLWGLLAVKGALLVACGRLGHMSVVYYLVAVLGAVGSLGVMIREVDLASGESCWWWFGNGFWLAGGSIVGGLGLELLVRT